MSEDDDEFIDAFPWGNRYRNAAISLVGSTVAFLGPLLLYPAIPAGAVLASMGVSLVLGVVGLRLIFPPPYAVGFVKK